jgi:hypothetical protein
MAAPPVLREEWSNMYAFLADAGLGNSAKVGDIISELAENRNIHSRDVAALIRLLAIVIRLERDRVVSAVKGIDLTPIIRQQMRDSLPFIDGFEV